MKNGKEYIISVIRCNTMSIQPPKKPEIPPTIIPIIVEITSPHMVHSRNPSPAALSLCPLTIIHVLRDWMVISIIFAAHTSKQTSMGLISLTAAKNSDISVLLDVYRSQFDPTYHFNTFFSVFQQKDHFFTKFHKILFFLLLIATKYAIINSRKNIFAIPIKIQQRCRNGKIVFQVWRYGLVQDR